MAQHTTVSIFHNMAGSIIFLNGLIPKVIQIVIKNI